MVDRGLLPDDDGKEHTLRNDENRSSRQAARFRAVLAGKRVDGRPLVDRGDIVRLIAGKPPLRTVSSKKPTRNGCLTDCGIEFYEFCYKFLSMAGGSVLHSELGPRCCLDRDSHDGGTARFPSSQYRFGELE